MTLEEAKQLAFSQEVRINSPYYQESIQVDHVVVVSTMGPDSALLNITDTNGVVYDCLNTELEPL